jgi:hypothetical protein
MLHTVSSTPETLQSQHEQSKNNSDDTNNNGKEAKGDVDGVVTG